MRKLFLFLSLLSFCTVFAQPGPRTWHDHLGINSCSSVSKLGSKIYASYYNGLVWFEETEVNPQTLNKINGLSDVGIRLLRTNTYNNKLLIIYDNANIDVLDMNGTVKNYSDIKLKAISGKKFINEITFYKQFAYMACGFGIVVFDTEKMEIKDTYYIGPNASSINVYQVALNDSLIFAATELGVYTSNYKTKILNNFNNWKLNTTLPAGPYCGVINVDNKILTCYSPSKFNTFKKGEDTLYIMRNNVWSKLEGVGNAGTTIYRMGSTYGNYYYLVDIFGVVVRDINVGANINIIYSLNGISPLNINETYFYKDYSGNIAYWVADQTYGLFKNYYYYDASIRVTNNGTHSGQVAKIDVFGGQVAIAPSNVDVTDFF